MDDMKNDNDRVINAFGNATFEIKKHMGKKPLNDILADIAIKRIRKSDKVCRKSKKEAES